MFVIRLPADTGCAELQRDHPKDFWIATGMTYSLGDFVRLVFTEFNLDWRNRVQQSKAVFRLTDLSLSRVNLGEAQRMPAWRARSRVPHFIKKMVAGI